MVATNKSINLVSWSIWMPTVLISSQSYVFGYAFGSLNSCTLAGRNGIAADCFRFRDNNAIDTGCPKGSIYNDFLMTPYDVQAATALVVVGAWVGSLLGGAPSEKYGRRHVLLFNAGLFIIGSLLSSLPNLWVIFLGRTILGFGLGIVSVVVPVLLAEISTDDNRGAITIMHQVMLTLGIFLVSIIAYGFVNYVPHGWAAVQLLAGIPSILLLLFRTYIPESPKWLVRNNRIEQAVSVLRKLRPRGWDVDAEIRKLQLESQEVPPQEEQQDAHRQHVRTQRSDKSEEESSCSGGIGRCTAVDSNNSSNNKDEADVSNNGAAVLPVVPATTTASTTSTSSAVSSVTPGATTSSVDSSKHANKAPVTWVKVFSHRKSVIIGCGLMLFQALTGINSVIFYSTTIFSFSGIHQSVLATSSVGLVNFLTTVLSASLVDRIGRKILLVSGLVFMLLALLVLSTVLLISGDTYDYNSSSSSSSTTTTINTQALVAVLAVLVYVFGFAIGLGAVVWVIISEIMPTALRVKAVSLFLSLNWGANLIIGMFSLSAIDYLGGVRSTTTDPLQIMLAEKRGVAYLYLIFACTTLMALIFVCAYVPETKGRNPEQDISHPERDYRNKRKNINHLKWPTIARGRQGACAAEGVKSGAATTTISAVYNTSDNLLQGERYDIAAGAPNLQDALLMPLSNNQSWAQRTSHFISSQIFNSSGVQQPRFQKIRRDDDEDLAEIRRAISDVI